MRLAVASSMVISGLCYSVLKLEPYSSCAYNCMYCYGRWYGAYGPVKPQWGDISLFRRVVETLSKRNLKTIPFRISTLIDPLQPLERLEKASLKALKIAGRHKIPVILNTKSTLAAEKPWRDVIEEMASEGLILYQLSLSTLDSEVSERLEPGTPSPEARLEAAARLSELGVPVIVRVQPAIPGLSDLEAEEIVRATAGVGARQVIIEAVRILKSQLAALMTVVKNRKPYEEAWPGYLDRDPNEAKLPIIKPPKSIVMKLIGKFAQLSRKYGLMFSTCKEGFLDIHTAPDCCGIHLLNPERSVLRATLKEYLDLWRKSGMRPDPKEFIRHLEGVPGYLVGEKLRAYPRELRRALKKHEARLMEVLSDQEKMRRVLPELNLAEP